MAKLLMRTGTGTAPTTRRGVSLFGWGVSIVIGSAIWLAAARALHLV